MTSYLDALPRRVGVHTLMDVVLQAHGQPCHELRAGSDTVAVKMGACWLHWRELTAARLQLLTDSLDLLNLFTAEQETMEGSAVNTDTSFVVKPDGVSKLCRMLAVVILFTFLVQFCSKFSQSRYPRSRGIVFVHIATSYIDTNVHAPELNRIESY